VRQSESEPSAVPKAARRDGEAHGRDWSWVEASVWNERMLAALGNGVRGGKWYSLIDKVHRPATLWAAWRKVAANGGAAGVDGQSVERFAARAEEYLVELEQALETGSYEPLAVKRVDIPKGPGKTRPLGIPAVKDRIVHDRLMEPVRSRISDRRLLGLVEAFVHQDIVRGMERWTPTCVFRTKLTADSV